MVQAMKKIVKKVEEIASRQDKLTKGIEQEDLLEENNPTIRRQEGEMRRGLGRETERGFRQIYLAMREKKVIAHGVQEEKEEDAQKLVKDFFMKNLLLPDQAYIIRAYRIGKPN